MTPHDDVRGGRVTPKEHAHDLDHTGTTRPLMPTGGSLLCSLLRLSENPRESIGKAGHESGHAFGHAARELDGVVDCPDVDPERAHPRRIEERRVDEAHALPRERHG